MEGRKDTRLDGFSSFNGIVLVRVFEKRDENSEVFITNINVSRVMNYVKSRHERNINHIQVASI